MQEEAYEWIRLDKDFEWICTVVYAPSPNYMFVQQLQQDNDVVAQIEVRLSLYIAANHRLIGVGSSMALKTASKCSSFIDLHSNTHGPTVLSWCPHFSSLCSC